MPSPDPHSFRRPSGEALCCIRIVRQSQHETEHMDWTHSIHNRAPPVRGRRNAMELHGVHVSRHVKYLLKTALRSRLCKSCCRVRRIANLLAAILPG